MNKMDYQFIVSGEIHQIMQDRYENVKASIKDFPQYKNLSTEEKMDFVTVVYHSSAPFDDAFMSYIKNNKKVVETIMDLTM